MLVAQDSVALHANELRSRGAEWVGPAAAKGRSGLDFLKQRDNAGGGRGGFEEGGEAMWAAGTEAGVCDSGGEGGEGVSNRVGDYRCAIETTVRNEVVWIECCVKGGNGGSVGYW